MLYIDTFVRSKSLYISLTNPTLRWEVGLLLVVDKDKRNRYDEATIFRNVRGPRMLPVLAWPLKQYKRDTIIPSLSLPKILLMQNPRCILFVSPYLPSLLKTEGS